MLKVKRNTTHKNFPIECYRASFYDFFIKGDTIDLRDCRIIASGITGQGKAKERSINIFFFDDKHDEIIKLSVRNILDVFYISPIKAVAEAYDKSKKVYSLEDYNAFDPANPQATLSFLFDLEDSYIICRKMVSPSHMIIDLIEEYEKHINYSGYEIYDDPKYIFFCKYKELYTIAKNCI